MDRHDRNASKTSKSKKKSVRSRSSGFSNGFKCICQLINLQLSSQINVIKDMSLIVLLPLKCKMVSLHYMPYGNNHQYWVYSSDSN